jgi:hypothetical protein
MPPVVAVVCRFASPGPVLAKRSPHLFSEAFVDRDETAKVCRIADMIERHLKSHPAAADTVEGVWRYWVPSRERASLESVELALALLKRMGRAMDRTLPDGRVIYLLAGSPRKRGDR